MEKTNPLSELVQFLKQESRLDLKSLALNHLLGLSGAEEGIETLLKNEEVMFKIIELTDDYNEEIAKNALCLLVNITAIQHGVLKILNYKLDHNIIKRLLGYVLDPQKKDADAACMILSNITRASETLEICTELIYPYLNDLLNVFVNIDYNRKGSKLHYLAPMFSNLSRSVRIRKWLYDDNPHVPLIKFLPFCNYEPSSIRRGGAIGTLRNFCFDPEYHEWLLSSEIDILTFILNPLMGNEDYPDDEMDMLPITLQYLPKEKQREVDVDIRQMILETLNKLCCKSKCREILRNNGVYYILREYHKWEKDPKALVACQNVVDILIRKEEEIGVDDISSIEVPGDITEKFQNIDHE